MQIKDPVTTIAGCFLVGYCAYYGYEALVYTQGQSTDTLRILAPLVVAGIGLIKAKDSGNPPE